MAGLRLTQSGSDLMNRTLLLNSIVFLVLLAIPLAAELYTAAPGNVPGTGFDILLYWPFDFAYVALAAILFVTLNTLISSKQDGSVLLGIGTGAALAFAWFAVAFLSVGQLHLSLGGQL